MDNRFSRTEILLGEDGFKRVCAARVAVFGIGGVGGHASDALVRSGIGAIDLFDSDTVDITNINRQLVATDRTVGAVKVEAAREHLLSVNPSCDIRAHRLFYSEENADSVDLSSYDYVIDAIDSVKSKVLLIKNASLAGTPIISAMGAGNKLDPTAFRVSDISKTSVCPLARIMRRELRAVGVTHLKVVYSEEPPVSAVVTGGEKTRHAPASIAFVPSVMGLILAGEVIKDIAGIEH